MTTRDERQSGIGSSDWEPVACERCGASDAECGWNENGSAMAVCEPCYRRLQDDAGRQQRETAVAMAAGLTDHMQGLRERLGWEAFRIDCGYHGPAVIVGSPQGGPIFLLAVMRLDGAAVQDARRQLQEAADERRRRAAAEHAAAPPIRMTEVRTWVLTNADGVPLAFGKLRSRLDMCGYCDRTEPVATVQGKQGGWYHLHPGGRDQKVRTYPANGEHAALLLEAAQNEHEGLFEGR